MTDFLGELAIILGGTPSISKTDRDIIETMIEIGAAPSEIARTFGYAPDQVHAVAEARSFDISALPPELVRFAARR